MSYRVIALDLDGTLLDPQKHILPESLSALHEARQSGIKILIVTGRHHVAIHPFYQALQLDTPAICCNGTYSYDFRAKKVLASDPLPPLEASQALTYMQDAEIQHLMYVDEAILYEHPHTVTRTLAWSDSLPVHQRPNLQQIRNFEEAIHNVNFIWKFATSSPNLVKLRKLSEQIEENVGLECEWSWFDQVDITKKGNSKGMRLQQWVESQGMSMKDVIAFGDNHNDLSMLETAGLGVAMGNGVDAVKERADIVIQDNTQPGIAEIIRQYVL
ncbi:pyridoxal phosphatase [Xenorhabdus szentirmaii]|uniref:Phosphatase ybhA n=1 Tax=Xenorhabdus szentirmaii DSM 16338 TaxID=1427518 RepID=W1IZ62_9GAMM|nr:MULTISPECIES: pyridoxal phosphatase [Xenorhabdus]MBD2782607.1 pyridoxal phosphatase [Xenorhabdus sp. 38]PHM31703.1 Cof family protein/peptidyl-prolyl cis-trans isomerase, cyclophilin type [Xenorhabdus szentirmaii DSM 16338]PHM41910.1 Cof family protein/peptidyl-prolyl cis-trans isomerase, cyclophilin type [Xenorhabdus szentirmaii]CDL83123.1 Phosphatase ybhA [Xenorhabdus szentirmaii DSM 16338]